MEFKYDKEFLALMLSHWNYVIRVYEGKANKELMYKAFTKKQKMKQAEYIALLIEAELLKDTQELPDMEAGVVPSLIAGDS